ncbi:MAG: hypothetical protein NZ954_02855 [Thermofilaceae archaeon]|nr:hypothetical protein [Thermofilaceae archaeon]MDW8004478.1 hypothetical protein [Thermofilaceae archaeon]
MGANVSAVCPYLYRDREGKFKCDVSGEFVDPGLMPCLANFRECPLYARAKTATTTTLRPHTPEVAPPGEAPLYLTEREVTSRLEIPASLEKGVEEMEEEVAQRIKAIEIAASDLDEKWKIYEEDAKKLMKTWEDVSTNGNHTLRALNNVIELYEKLLDNLNILLQNKRISDKSYETLKKDLENNLENYKTIRNNIGQALKNAERLVIPHIQRIKVAEARPELGKLRLSLMKLEQLYKEGKVSQEVFEKMRNELAAKIRWLEQLVGEAQ